MVLALPGTREGNGASRDSAERSATQNTKLRNPPGAHACQA